MKILINWIIVLLFSCLIFYLSSIEQPWTPIKFWNIDKFYHLIEYGIFALLLFHAITSTFKYNKKLLFIICVIIVGCYGISDEIHQLYVRGRYFSLLDMIFDIVGGIIGTYSYYKIKIHFFD